MSLDPVMPPYNASDPSASFLSSSCLDFLLIELVPLAYRVTQERDGGSGGDDDAAAAAAAAGGDKKPSKRSGGSATGAASDDALPSSTSGETTAAGDNQRASSTGAVTTSGSAGHLRRFDDEDEELDAVHYRLETLGYRVGQGLVERFSRDRPRLNDTLDVIKFLCKDLWSLVFGKNIDNLKTNHRGVYVLTDNVFRPFSRMSTVAGGQAVVRAQPFLWFPCGIVRGALAALGINASVHAEINELPGAVFQIKTLPAKS